MTATQPAAASPADTTRRPPSLFSLSRAHTRAQVLEQLRIPISIISSVMFPSLAFVFFVLPQQGIASRPEAALEALAQLGMFGVMSAFLFGYGIGVAEDRANPWFTYLRTLPAGPVPGTIGRAATAIMFSFFALVPLFIIGAFTTSAPEAFTGGLLSWWRVPLALAVMLLAGLPFLFLGLTIGYLCTSKVAIAVTQVVFFPLAFAGGMMLPPFIFADWLNRLSLLLPSRAARDAAVASLSGNGLETLTIPVLLGWTVALGAIALWANRRDQGRRFR